MENLPKDVLFSIAIDLDLEDLLNFCNSHPKIKDKVCKNKDIWIRKLIKEYPFINVANVKDVKGLYLRLNEKIEIDAKKYKKYKKGEYKIKKIDDGYYIPTATNKLLDLKIRKMPINPSSLFQVGEPLQFPNVSPDFFGYPELKDNLSGEPTIKYSFMVISEKALKEILNNLDDDKSFVTGPFNEIYPVVFRTTSWDKNYKKELRETIKKKKTIGRFYKGSILIYFGIW